MNLGFNTGINTSTGTLVWSIISLVLAIICGIVIYLVFQSKKVKITNKFLIWLKDFCNFKHLFLETILKVSYIILAIFITLSSFNYIGTSFVLFLGQLILGNLLLRAVYEGSLLIIMICKNTTEINKQLKKDNKN